MTRKIQIDIRASSVQVMEHGCVCTKVLIPEDANIEINIPPSMLSFIEDFKAKIPTIVDVAKEYKTLLREGGTTEDLSYYFQGFTGLPDILEQLKAAYFAATGQFLPVLKKPKRKGAITVDSADLLLAIKELQ